MPEPDQTLKDPRVQVYKDAGLGSRGWGRGGGQEHEIILLSKGCAFFVFSTYSFNEYVSSQAHTLFVSQDNSGTKTVVPECSHIGSVTASLQPALSSALG